MIGFMTIGPMLFGDFFKDSIAVDRRAPSGDGRARRGVPRPGRDGRRTRSPARSSGWRWPASSSPGSSTCSRPDIPAAIQRRFAFVYRLLDNKYYFDWFNEHVLVACRASWLGTGLWQRRRRRRDRRHPHRRLGANAIGGLGRSTRRLQSGYLYWYALVMIVGVIGLMTWQLWPYLGNLIGR